MPPGVEANWVTGSHDMGRVGSRLGDQLIDHMNMLALMLPGLAVTYQGEEVGMLDTAISWEDTRDPAGCACGPERYQECSRDPERTPFQVSPPPHAIQPNATHVTHVSPHVSHVTQCQPHCQPCQPRQPCHNCSGATSPTPGSATASPPGSPSTRTTYG